MKRIFSGIQPSGYVTLGNYLGVIQKCVQMQYDGKCFFCIVDLHALTSILSKSFNKSIFSKNTRLIAAAYIASGLDPYKNIFFVQNTVSYHVELFWILSCLTPIKWLSRMTHFKNKSMEYKDYVNLALYSYPVLMASDILLYKSTHVPIGDDQKQHLELARNIAVLFNKNFECNYFLKPEPCFANIGSRIMNLKDGKKKMSKSSLSDMSRICLTDTNDLIVKKIRKARTDSEFFPFTIDQLKFRPEVLNLTTIYAIINNQTIEEVIQDYGGKSFFPFKKDLSELLITVISPIREKIQFWLQNPELDNILFRGSLIARAIADKSMTEIKEIIGLYYKK